MSLWKTTKKTKKVTITMPANIPLPVAVRDAMVAEAAAEQRAWERLRWEVLAMQMIGAVVGSWIGASLAIWFWLFHD